MTQNHKRPTTQRPIHTLAPHLFAFNRQNTKSRWFVVGFLTVFHFLLISISTTFALMSYRNNVQQQFWPEFLQEPLQIWSLYDDPRVISDSDLQKVMKHLRPKLRSRNPNINYVDHALRFWGIEAQFADPKCLSGKEMRELLTDNRLFRKMWHPGTPSFLTNTNYGVRIRVQAGPSTASHVDHTVASLAEVGTPSDYPLITPSGETTFHALLEDTLKKFSLNQLEYEWTATVFALYAPTNRQWKTAEGQWISFDILARRMMRQKMLEGVCFGNHRLYSLALMLRADDLSPVFSEEARLEVIAFLKDATNRLIMNQSKDGFWDRNWEGSDWSTKWNEQAAITRRVLATGHTLEWWAIAPQEVQPPREVVIHAGQWLTKAILKMDDAQVRRNYTFLTHAGRALALWRDIHPAEVKWQ